MRLIGLAALLILAFAMPTAIMAQDRDIVVQGDVSRMEIERILEADNVDASRLTPRQVADLIAAIERGRAPDDFWAAYRAHVEAWDRLADAVDASRRGKSESDFEGAEALAKAEEAIGATFDQVERIARRYGARLPTPPWQALPTI